MRTIHSILSGIYALAAIIFAAGASAQTVSYTHNGATVKLRTIEIEAGAEKPFKVLHISDSHLTMADERDGARKVKLSVRRSKRLKNSEAMLRAHRQFAKENNMVIVHSGDMCDFVSQKNLECAKDIFSEGDWIVCAGNHEYSLYVGEAKEDAALPICANAYNAATKPKLQVFRVCLVTSPMSTLTKSDLQARSGAIAIYNSAQTRPHLNSVNGSKSRRSSRRY